MSSQGEHGRRRIFPLAGNTDPTRWHAMRRMGRERFVLIYGILWVCGFMGLWCGGIFGLVMVMVEGKPWHYLLWPVPLAFVGMMPYGIAWAYAIWWWTERTYRRRLTGQLCLRCKYDLRGTIAAGSHRCPECGYEQPREIEPVGSWRRR